ncbi:MAG: hypothetical protein ACKVLN_03505 [Rhodobacterales bacterium]
MKISARVKVISGNFPAVRIAGWAGNAEDNHLPNVTEIRSLVQLNTYGEVIESPAILGSGQRWIWFGTARRYTVILVLIQKVRLAGSFVLMILLLKM